MNGNQGALFSRENAIIMVGTEACMVEITGRGTSELKF